MGICRGLVACAAALLTGALMLAPAAAQRASLEVSQPSKDTVRVVVNQAVVSQSDTAFGEISVANPGIADVAGINERSLYVLGKAPGITTLTLLGQGGEVLAHVAVSVETTESEPANTVRVRRGGAVSIEQVD